jgi:hypothetical protein
MVSSQIQDAIVIQGRSNQIDRPHPEFERLQDCHQSLLKDVFQMGRRMKGGGDIKKNLQLVMLGRDLLPRRCGTKISIHRVVHVFLPGGSEIDIGKTPGAPPHEGRENPRFTPGCHHESLPIERISWSQPEWKQRRPSSRREPPTLGRASAHPDTLPEFPWIARDPRQTVHKPR